MKCLSLAALFLLSFNQTVFAECNQAVSQDPSITARAQLKLGQTVNVNGQTIGCSDGSNGFSDYVEVGSCLTVPILNASHQVALGRVLITCETR